MRNYFDVLCAPDEAGTRADPEDWIRVARRSSQPDAWVEWNRTKSSGLWVSEQG